LPFWVSELVVLPVSWELTVLDWSVLVCVIVREVVPFPDMV
jgi:hypothetical protein